MEKKEEEQTRNILKTFIGILILILIIAAVGGCLSGKDSATIDKLNKSETRENSEAGVTINATYLGNSVFEIKIDTHSGSLDIDMKEVSYIRINNNKKIIKPESWNGGIGGHHIEGTLTFPKFDDNTNFELIFQDVAGVKERVLKW